MAARKKTQKPEPVAVTTICSVCGLSWHDHGADPSTDDCIRLLKAELAKRPITVPVPQPYPVPYRPYTRPWYWEEWYSKRPHYPNEIYCTSSATQESTTYGGQQFKEQTPRLLNTSCKATLGSTV